MTATVEKIAKLDVNLALNLARHTASGWNDPALPDDLHAIQELLFLGRSHLLERLGAPEEMVQAARQAEIETP